MEAQWSSRGAFRSCPGLIEMTPLPRRLWVRVLAVLVVLVIGAALAAFVELPSVAGLRSWLRARGAAGWLALVLGLALALLTPVSRTALSLLVGAVAGFPAGVVVALCGGLLGGLAGFALSRWLGREAVTRLAGARLAAVDRVVSERDFVWVLAARIMPVTPFVFVSYAAGLSGVRLGPYMLGTAVGLVPWSVFYVGIGASVTSIGSWTTVVDVVLPVAIVVSLVLLGVGLWWRRRHSQATQPDAGEGSPTAPTPGQPTDAASRPPRG